MRSAAMPRKAVWTEGEERLSGEAERRSWVKRRWRRWAWPRNWRGGSKWKEEDESTVKEREERVLAMASAGAPAGNDAAEEDDIGGGGGGGGSGGCRKK